MQLPLKLLIMLSEYRILLQRDVTIVIYPKIVAGIKAIITSLIIDIVVTLLLHEGLMIHYTFFFTLTLSYVLPELFFS